jgi:hypothetical protein
MKNVVIALLTAQALIVPAVVMAQENHPQAVNRYYDRDHKDYHEWNESENRAYRHWLMEERHERQYRDYNRLKAAQQRDYWRWRHEHPDWR